MNRILTLLVAAFFCGTALLAQEPASPTAQPATPSTNTQATPSSSAGPTSAGPTTRIAPGSVIPVQLTKTVDAKKAKAGDEVVARVTEDLKNTSGAVIVPKDTEVVGHVTEAQRRNKEQKESELAIAFDKAVIKNGETMQMPMSIQAVIATPSQNANQNAQNSAPASGYPGGAMPGGGSTSPGMPGQSAGSSQGSMGGNAQMPSAPTEPNDTKSNGTNSASHPQPKITGDTKGVVGISNLSLSPTADAQQGSILTSEKNNVKLEGGTFMLLRVSQ
ncbi:MAG: hypothetical protein WBV36_23930 [Terriglobales bacterium]